MKRRRQAEEDNQAVDFKTELAAARRQARMRLPSADTSLDIKASSKSTRASVTKEEEKVPKKRGRRPKNQCQPEIPPTKKSFTTQPVPTRLTRHSSRNQVDVAERENAKNLTLAEPTAATSPSIAISETNTSAPATPTFSLMRRQSSRLRKLVFDPSKPDVFESCLSEDAEQANANSLWDDCPSSSGLTSSSSLGSTLQEPSPRSLPVIVLKRALSMQVLGDECWLSSSFMDLVITQFARTYQNVRFFSADFSRINHQDISQDEEVLTGVGKRKRKASSGSHSGGVTDILGRVWNASFSLNKPSSSLIFFANPNNIHWTLIRVVLQPSPELQLFEPMGMPSRQNRHTGLNFRSVPKSIIDWLDSTIPLSTKKSWLSVGCSVITNKHQVTSYDCGVACLLYAEKCGQGQSKEIINEHTTQEDITQYRKLLQDFMEKINGTSSNPIVLS